MVRRIGRNIPREIVGADNSTDVGNDLEKVRTQGETPTLQRAVVIDVVMNPNLLTDEDIARIRASVNNPKLASVMPANSVIARMVSHAQGKSARTNTILFPFFSSHLQLPVQPGEQIEVIYDDYFGGGQLIGYWLTRVASERTVEDVNYTHFDRRFDPTNNPAHYTLQQRSNRSTEQPGPIFQNGGGTPDTFTLNPSGSMDKPFESIVRDATAYRSAGENGPVVTPEPVPRWQKRPQEFVLQGSNNTIIVLGEDRKGGPLGAIEGPEQERDAKGQAGTIDIISGRGRFLPADDNTNPEDEFTGNTAPKTITNERNTKETDKAPYRRMPGEARLGDNPNEGNPDFQRDAARVYVSQQTEADNNFGVTDIDFTQDTLPHGDNNNEIPQPNEGQEGSPNKSYVVNKADHLRLIARKDEENGVEGTILVLREGESENDLCYLYVNKDGVHVDGPKVVLGRGLHESPDANAPGGEPYIRWSKFKETIDRMQDEIDELRSNLQSQIDKTSQQLGTLATTLDTAFAAATAVPYSPISSLQGIGAQTKVTNTIGQPGLGGELQQTKQQTEQAVSTATSDTETLVDESQSEKIFGE